MILRFSMAFGLFLVQIAWPALGQSGTIRFERLSIEEGLSQSVVTAIAQDSAGFVWFGTQDGLNRYDGYQFKVFRRSRGNSGDNLYSDGILSLLVDHRGRLWIGTDAGLNWFDDQTQTIKNAAFPGEDPNPTGEFFIEALFEDSDGQLWVSTFENGILQIDLDHGLTAKFDHTDEAFSAVVPSHASAFLEPFEGEIWVAHDSGVAIYDKASKTWRSLDTDQSEGGLAIEGRIFTMIQDHKGVVWFGGDYGLFRWQPNSGTLEYPADRDGVRLGPGEDTVWSMIEDREGAIWAGATDGLIRVTPDRSQQKFYRYDPFDPHSIGREVHMLFQDQSGVIWGGSYSDGLMKLPASNRHFKQYRHNPSLSNSLSGEAVRSMFVDRKNHLWVGTYEGGVSHYQPESDDFKQYRVEKDESLGLPSDNILDIAQTSDGRMWFGTIGGIGILDLEDQSWVTLTDEEDSPVRLNNHVYYSVQEDRNKRVWLGSAAGLMVLGPAMNIFKTYAHDSENPNSLIQNDVLEIWEDSRGRHWFATFGGLSMLEPGSDTFHNFKNDPENPHSLSHNTVLSFCEDHKGNIWIGTSYGLCSYREETSDFQVFGIEEAFPNMTIYGVQEDEDGHFWISTNAGLIRFHPEQKTLQSFDVKDGLQSNEFNQGGYAKGHDGRMFFGGVNGITAFFPRDIQIDQTPPDLLITEFLVRNNPVTPQPGDGPLKEAIYLTESIVLPYRDYLFAFEFASLNFNNPEKNRYAFKMEGLDENWVYTDSSNRRATYTKLEPGHYRFRVKGSNSAGVWNESGTQIQLQILPPFYRTWWAYTLYVLATAGLIFTMYTWRMRGVKSELGRQRVHNEKLQQLNRLKDDFLANTSHELRTPLHGIIGLAESLRDGAAGQLPPKADHNLDLIVQSGKRLSHLVNDLLDFSSLKSQNIQLNTKPVDLHSLADVIMTLLKPLAEQKKIGLINGIPTDLPSVEADEDRLQQVLFNLVGNGIKFTPSGSVTITAETTQSTVTVKIIDTGPGIPETEQETIFKSFQRGKAAKNSAIQGTGLGLALASRLITLHGGTIGVTNNPEGGATFHFTLPIAGTQVKPLPAKPQKELASAMLTTTDTLSPADLEVAQSDFGLDDFRVLIVDDDPINRQVLFDHLTMQNYKVSTAADGQEALAVIDESQPFDLVLLDIMMPQMSGYEVCRRLRERFPIHELPVIFLTAKNQISDQVSGFDAGANDYLTKPVTKLALLGRVRTHIKLLDANRNLEFKVAERTEQLRTKNDELEKLNKILEELSLTDPMTHLGNRRYLRKYLDREVALVLRNYAQWHEDSFSGNIEDNDLLFMLFDLDHFKRINDTYGHLAGDEVLMQIKGLMETVSREYDLLVRCGGEEFLIVFRRANRRQAPILAERLRKRIEDHRFDLSVGPSVRMTVSVGVASFPFRPDLPTAWTWEQVLDIADQALYLAKKNGRNAWAVLEATKRTPNEHFIKEIRNDMESLVNRGQLSLKSSIPQARIKRWAKNQTVNFED